MTFTLAQVDLLEANRQLVEAARLFEVRFRSQTFRLAEGTVARVIGGVTWQPAFGWLQAEAVRRGTAFDAEPAIYRVGGLAGTMTESASAGFADLCRAALHDETEWRNAPIEQSLQLFIEGAAVGPAISLHRGFLADVKPMEAVDSAVIELRAESAFRRRNYTPLGDYTDRDQRRRYPDDRSMGFIPSLVNKTIKGWLRG